MGMQSPSDIHPNHMLLCFVPFLAETKYDIAVRSSSSHLRELSLNITGTGAECN